MIFTLYSCEQVMFLDSVYISNVLETVRFTSPDHEISLLYTALTNRFDILRFNNIALQDPTYFSSLVLSCKDISHILLPLCHDLFPTGQRREPQGSCGWSREGSLPPSIGELWKRARRPHSFPCLLPHFQ